MFFDETCDILAESLSIVDGEQVVSLVSVEAGVPCAFYAPANAYAHGRFAQEQGTEAYVLVLPGSKASLAAKGRYASVKGQEFLIQSVQVHRFPSGAADNAECVLVQRHA